MCYSHTLYDLELVIFNKFPYIHISKKYIDQTDLFIEKDNEKETKFNS